MRARLIENINFERGQDPMDSMRLGNYGKRIIDKKKEELNNALSIIFPNLEIMSQSQETPKSGYDFQLQSRVEYKNIWWVLDYRGFFYDNPNESYSAIWGYKRRGPAEERTFNNLKLASEQLKEWLNIMKAHFIRGEDPIL